MTTTLDRGAGSRAPSRAATAARKSSRLGVLAEIVERRRRDVRSELDGRTLGQLTRAALGAPPPRDALGGLLEPGLHVIAEIKRRSPSAGDIAADGLDVAAQARAYQAGGAAVLSVLVEPHWFGGSLADLSAARDATSLPVLAKEFVVDARQLPHLRAAGADLVLLLAALHRAPALRRLVGIARDVGLEPLVEVHDERELEAALGSGARLVGVNNRDLRTLRVDPELAERLAELIPDDRLRVAESGVREPAQLRRWRAVGYDAALIGEALMRAGSDAGGDAGAAGDAGAGGARAAADARAVAARTAAFVAAGRVPDATEDPAAAARAPWVKVCGVTDEPGLEAAVRAGVDAIGLNLVPGSRRALSEEEARHLAARARAISPKGRAPRLVGVYADRDALEVAASAARIGLDMVQLHGSESPIDVARIPLPVIKALRLPPAPPRASATPATPGTPAPPVDALLGEAAGFLAAGNLHALLLDTADPTLAGGTGRRVDPVLAAALADRVAVILAGGLDAASVAGALRDIPAVGVDVAGGVEPLPRVEPPSNGEPRHPAEPQPRAEGRPTKDPFRLALFVKRARAARLDLPALPFGPRPVEPGLLEPDERGRWGSRRSFGGRFVPETLMSALLDLERAYLQIRREPAFWAELRELGRRYIGRPTPIYRADRLAAELERRAGREPGRLRLYLKREDLAHTGAHKINNALGQTLLTRRLGKTRVIAETGAGQHGVATATACALLDLQCVVYMGAEDIRRQAPNVLRMRALGAEVREVTSGTATLKDAINEAMRDWVTNVATSHYVLGSVVGMHPYPALVRDLQRVIGDEAAAQLLAVEGRLPDVAMACVGGGSNAMGLLTRFIGEPSVRLVGVEAGGEGLQGRHAAALAGGSAGVLHGSRSYLLQDADGQVMEAHSISAGLDYPGIGPQLAALYEDGRLEILSATDDETVAAVAVLTRTEGILPALEPAHALAALGAWLAGGTAIAPLADDALVLLGLSGRGDKDLAAIADRLGASA